MSTRFQSSLKKNQRAHKCTGKKSREAFRLEDTRTLYVQLHSLGHKQNLQEKDELHQT